MTGTRAIVLTQHKVNSKRTASTHLGRLPYPLCPRAHRALAVVRLSLRSSITNQEQPISNKPHITLRPTSFLTYAQINGGHPSGVETFRSLLSRFARQDLLLFCSYADATLFGPDLAFNWEAHDSLVKTYLLPGLLEVRPHGERWPILHRQLLLFLAKEAAARGSEEGLKAFAPVRKELSYLILMANDRFEFPSAPRIPGQNNLGFLAAIVSSSEGSRFPAWRHKMVRTALILRHVLEQNPDLIEEFDVFEAFERASRIPLRTYISMVFAVACKRLSEPSSPSSSSVGANWFRDTLISSEQAELFFADVGATAEAIGDTLRATSPALVSDFRILAEKPLLRVGDNLYPFDFDLLVAKADSGIFWKILNYLSSNKEKESFIAFWGRVFELYVNWFLDRSCPKPAVNRFIPGPAFDDDLTDQVCDSIILSGTTACFLEYKGGVFRADSKYTGEPSKLKKEIEDKLIGTESRRKGLWQLARAIEAVSEPGRRIRDVDLSRVTKIIPVLVVRDDIALTLCFNEYLNFRFQNIIRRRNNSRLITPLFVLAIDDLEKIAAYLPQVRFHRILEDRWRNERTLSAPFFAVDNPSMPKADSLVAEIANAGMDIVASLASEIMFAQEFRPKVQ